MSSPSKPSVTVVTPTFNHAGVIGQCIESVLHQTFSDWEMIIVDDGSTDETAAIAEDYRDERIRVIRQANRGVAQLKETYNVALDAARADVIGILEGDDYWPPDKLSIQVPDFSNAAVAVSSGFTEIIRDGVSEGRTPSSRPPQDASNNVPVGRSALYMVHPKHLTFTFPVSTMVRTSALRAIGGFQQPSYLPLVDFPTFLRLTLEGEFRFHDQVLGYWRRHDTSVTLSRMSEIVEGAYRYSFEFLREFRDRLPVSDAELDAVQDLWDEQNAMACILRGRLLSQQGNRTLAAKAFREAGLFKTAKRTNRIAAIAATLSQMGLPVEPFYRLLGRVPLDQATTLHTGDMTVSVDDMKRERVVCRWR